MAQQLRSLAFLYRALVQFPAPTQRLINIYNSSPGDSIPSSGLCGDCRHVLCLHAHKENTDMNKINTCEKIKTIIQDNQNFFIEDTEI